MTGLRLDALGSRVPRLRSEILVPLALVAFFLISRAIVARFGGIFFDAAGLSGQVQHIDTPLLEHHLLQSLWWLNGQPPLWNLVLGVVVKAAPSAWPVVFHRMFELLGVAETLMLYALLLRVGARRVVAAVLAGAFMVTPPILASELILTYDYPTLILITATVLLAARLADRATVGRSLALFACAAALISMRTLFQVGWLILLALAMLVVVPNRRVVILGVAAPLIVVLSLYVKTEIMFGTPTTSTWAGMGLARIAEHGYSLPQRQALVDAGRLHRVSLVEPLSPLSDYAAVGADPAVAPTGIPLLDERLDAQHHRNLHNKAYITISRQYWADDIWLIRHDPSRYLRSVITANAIFFRTPDRYPRLGAYDRWFMRLAYGARSTGSPGPLLIALYLAALAHALYWCARFLRKGAPQATVILATAALLILYVGLVGNTTELGENYRFRFYLDPLVLVMLTHLSVRVSARTRPFARRPLPD